MRTRALAAYLGMVAIGAWEAPEPGAASRWMAALPRPASSATPARAAPPPAAPEPEGPCPREMAQVGKYCIDRYEAHLVVGGKRHPHNLRPPKGRYEARAEKGVFPQAYISQREAARACQNAGKRLCSWLEWKRACQGPKWSDYPNPKADRGGSCNVGKKHLLSEKFPNQRWTFFEHFNNPSLNLEPGYLARSGAHPDCGTADGVYDLVGNLHEWVADSVSTAFMRQYQRERIHRHDQPWQLGNGIFMGGFYSTTTEHGHGCHFTTIAHDKKYHDYSTGFRCCRDAEQG